MKSRRGKPITASDEKSYKIYYPVILVFIALLFYGNTVYNEYAFDDFTYIVDNNYIQQGFSGIGKLMSSDALESYIKSKGGSVNDLGGGRYRPLSLVSFAIEYQFFKESPFVSHLVNLLLYMLTAFLLFRLLAIHFFRKQLLLAFITTLIFIIHPLHTEVVANIKGRDEIMSLLFIVLSLEYFFRYVSMGRVKEKILSWSFFMLALLSKEYALFFIGFIPAVSYVIIKMNRRQAFVSALPFLVITGLYIVIRLGSVGFSTGTVLTITNNPYLLASVPQAWATKIFVLLYYIKLLFVPFPLACDYSYNTFPYRDFTDIWVIASLLIYTSLIIASIYLLKKRNIASIGLLLFLFPLFFVSNFLMDIGATMGERLIYHSSLGFAMLVALGLVGLSSRIFSNGLSKKYFTLALAAIFCLIAAKIVVPRNTQWKNSFTLFTHDVKVVPKNILVNNNAANMLLKELDKDEDDIRRDSLANLAIGYLKSSINVYNGWEYLHLNLGFAYYKKKDYKKAGELWKQAKIDFPQSGTITIFLNSIAGDYFSKAMEAGKNGDTQSAARYIYEAIDINPNDDKLWYNLGGILYTQQDYTGAKQAWEKTLSINPNHKEARSGLNALGIR